MDERLFFSATERNRKHIAKVLYRFLPKMGSVLEVASGSGEHAVYFQKNLPNCLWQASDPDILHRRSINAWIEFEGLNNHMPKSIYLDVEDYPWQLPLNISTNLIAIVAINLLHISNWSCTISLFNAAKQYLNKDSLLFLYGPFKKGGLHTSESNLLFDQSLRSRNSNWGVRDLNEVSNLAVLNGFIDKATVDMPANNMLLIYKKR